MKSNVRGLMLCAAVIFLHYRYVHCKYDLPGETSPASVEIEVGDSVNITCRMNPEFFEERSVRDLYFVNTITHLRVPNLDIKIVNENTIVFMLRNAKESKSTYCCMCGSDAIMETRVYVGHKPQPVTNFTCTSYNFEYMKCNFTKPENYVLTQYNVSYHFDLKAYKYTPACDFKRSPLVTCTAFETYHSKENIFHYEIMASNTLGTLTQRFDVDSMSVMVLEQPGQNFSLRQLTADSATFTFRFKNYSRGLQWEVILEPKNLSAYELSPQVHPIPISNNEFELSLKNLKYAFYEYRIGLRVRLTVVNNWSDLFNYWFRTLSRIPDRPPRIDVGAFETDPSDEQIRLYWETLQPYEYNGDNFNYVIEQLGGMSEPRKPLLLESNSAVFLWKKELKYEFSIRSRNDEGMSKDATRITIPAMTSEIKRKNSTPPAVYSIYHENTSAFTITWIAPKNLTALLDYTVFWCRKKSLLLNVCEGSIHFERVPRDLNHFTTPPQEHTLSMAVSANYEQFNTGLHWTECTMSEKTDLIKMEPKVEATSATSIKIEWGTGNICPSILEGYNLSYCAVNVMGLTKPENETLLACVSDEAVQQISINKTFKRWELQHLKPFTTYKIEMFMFAKHKFGKKSNPQLIQTWESAPSAPLQLNVSHITNASAIVSWLPPSEPNGKVRAYIIVLNNESIEIPSNIDETSGRVVYRIENLSMSTVHVAYVIARTLPNLRSPMSNIIEFKTLVGYPSMPGPVSLQDSKNDAQIKWITPKGRTDFYEVAVTLLKGDEVMSRRISFVIEANSCAFRIPKCFDHEYRTTVDVRSVNAASLLNEIDISSDHETGNYHDADAQFYDGDDELSCIGRNDIDERQKLALEIYRNTSAYRLYKSAWQRGPIFSCAASVLGTIMLYVTLPIFFIGCLMVSLYFMRQKYNKMANIHCTLPAALDAYMTKDISGVSTTLSHNFITNLTGEGVTNQSSNINTASNIQHNISTQNEELCLLEATSQNSFVINDHVQQLDFPQCHQSTQNISTALLEEDSAKNFEMSSDSETNDANDYLNVNLKNDFNPRPNNNMSPYVQASDILNQSQHNGIVVPILPIHNSYIKPNALTNWQNITEELQTPTYISPENISKPRTENILEAHKSNTQPYIEPSQPYISASDLVTSNNGYTTLEQLNKLSSFSPAANNLSNRNETLPVNDSSAISGYVTPRELTAFGQQHQQQHNFS